MIVMNVFWLKPAAAVCAALVMTASAQAATFTFDGTIDTATFSGYAPETVTDLSFRFSLEADPSQQASFNNIAVASFSGLSVNGTFFDATNTFADVQNRGNGLQVTIGAQVNGVVGIRGSTNDFLFGFFLSDPAGLPTGLDVAATTGVALDLVRAQVANGDQVQVRAGTLTAGSVTVTQEAPNPVPLPPVLAFGLGGIAVLAGLRRARRA